MTSQPVEQRGVAREWNYTETHLPVRRIDEHNACVTALRAALAREAALRDALRARCLSPWWEQNSAVSVGYQCDVCAAHWRHGQPESHAPGCLAALGQEESKP